MTSVNEDLVSVVRQMRLIINRMNKRSRTEDLCEDERPLRRMNQEAKQTFRRPLISMKFNMGALVLCTVALYFIALTTSTVLASYYKQDQNYDPEQQTDGIPVFSARSIRKLDDDWNNDMQESVRPIRIIQRRQADNDLDDGLEEEDEDEYKSGSSPHESIESPSYGESKRFAKDGDDIEDFFDKHLGPPKENDAGEESSEQPSVAQQEVPAIDPDDHFEAAASGPLASIFQTLLGDRKNTGKRPFLQISTSSSGPDDSDTTTTISTSKDEPSAAPAGKGLKASPTQSFAEASPIALAIAPSSLAVREIAASHEHASTERDPAYGPVDAQAAVSGEGVREIYIGRRPTVMSYLQQQQQQVEQQQKSFLGGYTPAGSANVWRGPNGQPVVYEQDHASDYARHPVAASYVYQQQPSNSAQSAVDAGPGEEEQTVTYGLSFGGSSSADEPTAEQEAADAPAGNGAVESMPSQQMRGYSPYNARYTTSSSRAFNNYHDNYYQQPAPAGYMRAYPVHPQQMLRQQPHQMVPMYQQPSQYQPQQVGNGPTRYHRDPSESSTHMAGMRAALAQRGIAYDHSNYEGPAPRGVETNANQLPDRDQFQERQRLLASLDREIKASAKYRTNQENGDASAQRGSYLNGPHSYGPRQLVTYKEVKKTVPGDELDTYTSYHRETDPYKTQTTTSRMVNNPLRYLVPVRQQYLEQYGTSLSHDPASTSFHVANQSPDAQINSVQASSNGLTDANQADKAGNNAQIQQSGPQQTDTNLLTGPLSNYDTLNSPGGQEDLTRNNDASAKEDTPSSDNSKSSGDANQGRSRVRRDDSDEREIDNDTDDDGVWVDDDEDDDNRQQSSDVNETSVPDDEEADDDGQQDDASNSVLTSQQINPPGMISGRHGYELSPNDLMIYHG